jgi:osmotically inducible protein OsmC
MPIRKAEASWEGDLLKGKGDFRFTGYEGKFSFNTRMGETPGTNPEELLGAAHASCFSMALAFGLSQAGHVPKKVATKADVHFDKVGDGLAITKIVLHCTASPVSTRRPSTRSPAKRRRRARYRRRWRRCRSS